MVKFGIVEDNCAALHSVTAQPARMNKLDKRCGLLETGKEADLVVLDPAPPADLDALTMCK